MAPPERHLSICMAIFVGRTAIGKKIERGFVARRLGNSAQLEMSQRQAQLFLTVYANDMKMVGRKGQLGAHVVKIEED